jgi:hypothetical protein
MTCVLSNRFELTLVQSESKPRIWPLQAVTASDSKTTQSGGDNRKQFPLGAALQIPQNFPFALFIKSSNQISFI